jgi:ribosomal protein S18 acetylase RimI-like enzyme
MRIKKEIDEISFYTGVLSREIGFSLFEIIEKEVKTKKIIDYTLKFAKENFVVDLTEFFNKNELLEVIQLGVNESFTTRNKKLKFLEKRVFWTSLMYKIVKDNFKFKKFGELEYWNHSHCYFFFDRDLQDYIGFISYNKLDDILSGDNYPIKKSAICVSTSAIDKAFKGMGYGKKMYLAVIEDAGCLLSDTGLYAESLNIWVNVLPKVVKYTGYISEFGELKKISGRMDTKQENIRRFFATNDRSFLKKEIEK